MAAVVDAAVEAVSAGVVVVGTGGTGGSGNGDIGFLP